MAMKISKRGKTPKSGRKKSTNLYAAIFVVLIFFIGLIFIIVMASKQPAPEASAQPPQREAISLHQNTIIDSLAEGSPLSIATK